MSASMSPTRSVQRPRSARRFRLAIGAVVLALCCLADAFVLRTVWTRRQIADGQFRRGYFEKFDGVAGLAIDSAIRPEVVPAFLLSDGDRLAVPPGMTMVAAITPDMEYELTPDWSLAPYVVIGAEAPLGPTTT